MRSKKRRRRELQAILDECRNEIEKELSRHPLKVRKYREWIKALRPLEFTVWLGGPGRAHPLFDKRELIAKILEERGFDVVISEKYPGSAILPEKEREQVAVSNLIVIIEIGPGALAEVLGFAEDENLREKMVVFVPETYENGYAWQEIQYKGIRVAPFSLQEFEKCSCKLFVEVWNVAEGRRVTHFSDKKIFKTIEDIEFP